jgi:anti-sigma B factor antagonist
MMKALIGDRQAVRAGVSVPVRPDAEAAGSEVPPIISFADMPRRVSVRIVTTPVVAEEDVPMVSTDLSTVEYDGHAIVALCGELDVTDAAGVAAVLAGILAGRPNIIIDLAGLEFIDCGGLRALAGVREQARRAGGDLLLAAPQRLVLRVLALTGLADVASVCASVEQAKGSARSRP